MNIQLKLPLPACLAEKGFYRHTYSLGCSYSRHGSGIEAKQMEHSVDLKHVYVNSLVMRISHSISYLVGDEGVLPSSLAAFAAPPTKERLNHVVKRAFIECRQRSIKCAYFFSCAVDIFSSPPMSFP